MSGEDQRREDGTNDVFDRMDRALAESDTVPLELAAEFLATLPRAEREAWLRTALDFVLGRRGIAEDVPDQDVDKSD
jgi:hypothetical protein